MTWEEKRKLGKIIKILNRRINSRYPFQKANSILFKCCGINIYFDKRIYTGEIIVYNSSLSFVLEYPIFKNFNKILDELIIKDVIC